MTPEEINRVIAEKVMGWTLSSTRQSDYWEDEKGVYRGLYSDWDPYHRIDDAMMALEKANSEGACFSVIYDDFGHWACVGDGMQPAEEKFVGATVFDVDSKDQWTDTPSAAICLALVEAGKDE